MIITNKLKIIKYLSNTFVKKSDLWKEKEDYFDFPNFIITNEKWWNGGFDPLCTLDEKRDFYELAHQALGIILKFAEINGETKCCAGPFHTSKNFVHWKNLNEFDSYNSIRSLIKNKQYFIIDVLEDKNILGLIVENNFRYFSEIGLLFEHADLIIEPTHNSELIIFSEDCEKQKAVFSKIIENTDWKIYDE